MDKKLNFGVIGAGYFGKNYVRLLENNPGTSLVVVADNAKESSKVINSPDIDCVIIATPAATHFKLAVEALKAGKHVFLEKPMVTKLTDAYELEKYVKKSRKVFLLGHQYLYNDYVRHLKQEIDLKVLGRVKYVFAENFYHGPIRRDVGCFWETAGHELSVIDYLFGPLNATDISGRSQYFFSKYRDDFSVVNFKIKRNILVTIAVSWFMPKKERNMTFSGDKGMAKFDDVEAKEKLSFIFSSFPRGAQNSSHFFSADEKKVRVPDIDVKEPLYNELTHFIDCVKNNKTPLTDIKHGIRVTKLLHDISLELNK